MTNGPDQQRLFDDGFGERVASFSTKRGLRPLKPHEIETMNQLGESVCRNALPLLIKLLSMRSHIKTYLERNDELT